LFFSYFCYLYLEKKIKILNIIDLNKNKAEMGNSNPVKTNNYYSVEYLGEENSKLPPESPPTDYCHTGLTQKSKILVKRSKSYAVPENQVLPNKYIASKPLKQLNKFKTDGLKKTWKRDETNRPCLIKNRLVAKSSFNLYNYKTNSIGINNNSKSVENLTFTNETSVSDENIFDSIEKTNMFEQSNNNNNNNYSSSSSQSSASETCTNSTLLSFNNNFNFKKSNIFPISVR